MSKFDLVIEALDFGGDIPESFEDFIDEGLLHEFLDGESYERLRRIFPKLGEDDKFYLKKLASDSFKDVILRLKDASGLDFDELSENIPMILGFGGFNLLNAIKQIESGHEQELMDLAVKSLMEIPFFKPHEEAFKAFKFDLNLNGVNGDVDLSDFDFEGLEEDDETSEFESEDPVQQLINDVNIENLEIEKLKREFSNLFMQGSALFGMDFYKLLINDISRIVGQDSKKLLKMYKYFTCIGDLGYWMAPMGIEELTDLGGKSNFESKDDGVHIQVYAQTFPYLFHELIKALIKYVQQAQPGVNDIAGNIDSVPHERLPIAIGKKWFSDISKEIPPKYLMDMLSTIITDEYGDSEELLELLRNLQSNNNLKTNVLKSLYKRIDDYID